MVPGDWVEFTRPIGRMGPVTGEVVQVHTVYTCGKLGYFSWWEDGKESIHVAFVNAARSSKG